jgi:hypothetical protein
MTVKVYNTTSLSETLNEQMIEKSEENSSTMELENDHYLRHCNEIETQPKSIV